MELTTEQMVGYIAMLEHQLTHLNTALSIIAQTNPEVLETPEILALQEHEELSWN